MKILRIDGERAVVSSGSVERTVAVNFITDPKVGDYVMVHAGFAIEKLDTESARETLRMLEEL